MDFGWAADDQELMAGAERFAAAKLPRELTPGDRDAFRAAWSALAEFGFPGLAVSAEHGGAGAGALSVVAALEGLGRGCEENGLLFSLNAHMWAVAYPLDRFGSDDLKAKYLPGLAGGTLIGAHAMSEPDSGSDAFSMATRALPDGDGFRLSGSKTFVTNAPYADVFLVFAVTDPRKSFPGITGFLIERDLPGLTVGPPLRKMGLTGSPMGELFFDDCLVPASSVLGRPGSGIAVFNAAMERERSLILATTIGSMERELERALEYAATRQQFSRPIGSFQAVAHRLVDMKVRLETARLLLYRLAWKLDRGENVKIDAAMTKLWLSECYTHNALDALVTHGGYGYLAEYGLERQFRDAIGSKLYSGTSDMQRNMVARALGLKV